MTYRRARASGPIQGLSAGIRRDVRHPIGAAAARIIAVGLVCGGFAQGAVGADAPSLAAGKNPIASRTVDVPVHRLSLPAPTRTIHWAVNRDGSVELSDRPKTGSVARQGVETYTGTSSADASAQAGASATIGGPSPMRSPRGSAKGTGNSMRSAMRPWPASSASSTRWRRTSPCRACIEAGLSMARLVGPFRARPASARRRKRRRWAVAHRLSCPAVLPVRRGGESPRGMPRAGASARHGERTTGACLKFVAEVCQGRDRGL